MKKRGKKPNVIRVQDPIKRIPLLNSIGRAYQSSELTYSISLLREALSLCNQVKLPFYRIQTLINLARCLGSEGGFDEALKCLAIAEELLRNAKDRDAQIDVKYVRSLTLLEQGEFEEAYTVGIEVYQYRKALQNSVRFIEPVRMSADRFTDRILTDEESRQNNEFKLGTIGKVLSLIDKSRIDYLKSLQFTESNIQVWQTTLHNLLQNDSEPLYTKIRNYPSVVHYFNKALASYNSSGKVNSIINLLSSLGDVHRAMGNYKEAYRELSEAWNMLQQSSESPLIIQVSICLTKYYVSINNFDSALIWVTQALESATSMTMEYSKAPLLSLKGKVLFLLKDYQEAISTLKSGLKIAEDSNQQEVCIRCLKYLYLTYKDLNKIKESFIFLERYETEKTQFIQTRLISDNQAVQNHIPFNEDKREIMYFNNEKTSDAKDAERMSQEFAGLIREVWKKNDLLDKLRKESSSLVNYSKETQQLLKPIIRTISDELEEIKHQQDLSEKLQAVQPHFISILRKKYPSLSKAEIKVCILLRLELTSKEIASALEISIRTVENHRLHIRQKLLLKENQSVLEAFRALI